MHRIGGTRGSGGGGGRDGNAKFTAATLSTCSWSLPPAYHQTQTFRVKTASTTALGSVSFQSTWYFSPPASHSIHSIPFTSSSPFHFTSYNFALTLRPIWSPNHHLQALYQRWPAMVPSRRVQTTHHSTTLTQSRSSCGASRTTTPTMSRSRPSRAWSTKARQTVSIAIRSREGGKGLNA